MWGDLTWLKRGKNLWNAYIQNKKKTLKAETVGFINLDN